MPSPLMRMSLGRGACMALKNMVFGAALRPGSGAGAPPSLIDLPQLGQKRKPPATSLPQCGHLRAAAAAAGIGCDAAGFLAGTMPSDAPQDTHACAFSALSASQLSHTRPRVIGRRS